ncbi:Endonuclease/exonuclease/phosphatase, partial [Mycena epipterygia]
MAAAGATPSGRGTTQAEVNSRRNRGTPTDEEHAPAFFSQKRSRQQLNNPVISRNTRAQFNLVAVNINGRKRDSIYHPEHKWHGLNRLMYDEKIGVLVVGETHLSTEQALEIQEHPQLAKRMDIYHSPNPENPSTRGIAIILNRELTNTTGVKIHYLIPGRAILAVIPWHGRKTHTVLGVYAPAESMEANAQFWDDLCEMWLTLDLPVPDSVAGDMNVVEEPIDRLPHRRDAESATAALARFKRLLDLKDGWRTIHPDAKEYTYVSHSNTFSRLDRIYVSPALLKNCREWEISDAAGGLTDHRMVSVRVSAPGSPYIGRGRYTIPLFLLRDKQFMDFVITRGATLESTMDENPGCKIVIQEGFKAYKAGIRDFAQKRAKEAIGALEQNKQKLQGERKALLNLEPTGPTTASTPTDESPGAAPTPEPPPPQREQRRTDTHIRCHTDLDRITKFTVQMSKDRKPRDTLSFLQRTDTTPARGSKRSDEMAEIARDYHNDLQSDESE